MDEIITKHVFTGVISEATLEPTPKATLMTYLTKYCVKKCFDKAYILRIEDILSYSNFVFGSDNLPRFTVAFTATSLMFVPGDVATCRIYKMANSLIYIGETNERFVTTIKYDPYITAIPDNTTLLIIVSQSMYTHDTVVIQGELLVKYDIFNTTYKIISTVEGGRSSSSKKVSDNDDRIKLNSDKLEYYELIYAVSTCKLPTINKKDASVLDSTFKYAHFGYIDDENNIMCIKNKQIGQILCVTYDELVNIYRKQHDKLVTAINACEYTPTTRIIYKKYMESIKSITK